MSFIQSSFQGGMNLFSDDANLAENQYALAFNVRNRKTTLQPIKLPLLDETAPKGKKQGLYEFDKYLLLFCLGKAYYKDITDTDSVWTQINSLLLDPYVDFIYVCAVPASTLNLSRKLTEADKINGTSTDSGLTLENLKVNGTLAGLVVQDGINQPWLILPDASAEILQKYSEWSLTDREYVPVMKQMGYANGILFGIAPDGVTILRSVSGRPCDFVVNVDAHGNKGGDAYTTSYNVGVDTINYIGTIASGALLIATSKTCYLVALNYDSKIFGEPTFINNQSFSAGIVNQFSFLEILGDYGFIDFEGLRSLNAVAQIKDEGRASLFSSIISAIFSGKQTSCAAINFSSYSLYAVSSIYGDVVAVYDNTRQLWVCLDDYELDEPIKMFANANQASAPTLYAITDQDVYKLFGGTQNAVASVKLRSLTSGALSTQLQVSSIRTGFINGTETGVASALVYENTLASGERSESLEGTEVENLKFTFRGNANQCWKVQPKIVWTNDAELAMVELEADNKTQRTPLSQTVKRYAGK